MVKFKVDENLPADVARLLNNIGHDALTMADQQMRGSTDARIADACQSERRTLITLDLDFADIRAYPPADYSGIIVLRLTRLDKDRVLAAIQNLIAMFAQEPLAGNLWIVSEGTVRIRS